MIEIDARAFEPDFGCPSAGCLEQMDDLTEVWTPRDFKGLCRYHGAFQWNRELRRWVRDA